MSTRSFVGVMSDAGILGAYVHGDGHLSWVPRSRKILGDGFWRSSARPSSKGARAEASRGSRRYQRQSGRPALQDHRRIRRGVHRSGCEPMTLRGVPSHEGGQEYAYAVARPDGLIDIYKIGYGVRDHLKWTVGLDEELSNAPAGAVVVKA